MDKFIVNHEIDGINSVDISDESIKNSEVIIVLDESTNNELSIYYKAILNMMDNNNRVYIIAVGNESNIRKPISLMVANHRNYNIYRVDSKETIDKEYIETILEREPTIDEVQEFVGGDISAYADLNLILLGIEDLVVGGDIEGLKSFIEGHLGSIENLTFVVEYMKKVVDSSNSKELINRIDELKSKLKGISNEIEGLEEEKREIEEKNRKLSESIEMNKRELSRVMTKNAELEQINKDGGMVIQNYSEVRTQLLARSPQHIMYFKEISYVQYTNTLINVIMECLRVSGKRVKLIIYDNRVGIASLYKPLKIVNGAEFAKQKSSILSLGDAFVAIEPNPMILTSVLESSDPTFDIVIVYDRLRQTKDMVTGNNVTRFFVINSSTGFNEIRSNLKITDLSCVITRPDSSIGEETINIPSIQQPLGKLTSSGKIAQYQRLITTGSKKKLIHHILEKARIATEW